ncbi:MAG: LPP20 family lipoprotein [Cytophagales bacterium]|nr:LPP20 family lipoprotein [Cytophagales bacterium]
MVRSTLLFCALIAVFAACKSTPPQTTGVPSQPSAPDRSSQKPGWLLQKPQSSLYYQGIGNASMSDPDYIQTARNEALDDLAAEISVTISSSSLLYQLDLGDRFREEYQNAIKADVDQQLEGHELVDSWQDGQMYWAYYRLSKSDHQQRLEREKNTALEKGLDFYGRALNSSSRQEYGLAISYFTQSLAAIENYLGEDTKVTYNGNSILLANEAYAGLKNTINGIRFEGPGKVLLNRRSLAQDNLEIAVRYENAPVKNLPIRLSGSAIGTREKTKTSGSNGSLLISHKELEAGDRSFMIEANIERLNSTRSELLAAIMKQLPAPKKEVLVETKTLTLYISSAENNLGKPLPKGLLNSMLVGALGQQGAVFTDDEKDADLLMKVTADTREGSELSGLFTSFLDITVQVVDKSTNKEIYADAIYDLKGIQLSYEKAGLKAYQDAREKIEKELAPNIWKNLY